MKRSNIAWYLLFIVILGVIWEFTGQRNSVRLLVSSPSRVAEFFAGNPALILESTLLTFYESFVGFLIAIIGSSFVMFTCLLYPRVLDFILPLMVTSQVIPLITLAPLLIMIFGSGVESKIVMASLLCIFPIFIGYATGVKLISRDIIDFAKLQNASKISIITKIQFPLSMPSVFAGLKVSATLAVIGAIVGEFNGSDLGLGKNLFLAAKRLEPELMISSLVASAILGGTMYGLVVGAEKLFGKWYLKE